MKALLTAIVIITSVTGYSQPVIYVDSPKDKRFVMYRDSLKNHLQDIRKEMEERKAVRLIKTPKDLECFMKKYGYALGSSTLNKGGVVKENGNTYRIAPDVVIGRFRIETEEYIHVGAVVRTAKFLMPEITVIVNDQVKNSHAVVAPPKNSYTPTLTVIHRIENPYGQVAQFVPSVAGA